MDLETKKEIEVFGVTYDRYVLLQLHKILVKTLGLENILEMPSHGAKAAGSLYSVGFGLAGCKVSLADPDPEMMSCWDEINAGNMVKAIYNLNPYETGFQDNSFDLAWNFVTWTELDNPLKYLLEMKRISKKGVLFVTCNNFQPGYPWHRLLHYVFGFPWTHGQVEYNHITRVKKLFRQAGLSVMEYGAIDTPGWPDPSGPRDVRLHRNFNVKHCKPVWEVPIIRYIKTGKYPSWMKLLGRWDMKFRKGVFKLPMSHLFYVLGVKG